MSQNEWQSAWDSVQRVIMIYIPYVIASLVVSFCGFIERHWKKEPFSPAKLITGLFSDLIYGLTLVFGALWLSRGNHICAMFVLFVGLARGRKWADNLIDKILWQRYGQGSYYGNGYSNNPFDQYKENGGGALGNQDNDDQHKELDPRE